MHEKNRRLSRFSDVTSPDEALNDVVGVLAVFKSWLGSGGLMIDDAESFGAEIMLDSAINTLREVVRGIGKVKNPAERFKCEAGSCSACDRQLQCLESIGC